MNAQALEAQFQKAFEHFPIQFFLKIDSFYTNFKSNNS
jgi:hypothetical protein